MTVQNRVNTSREWAIEEMAQIPIEELMEILPQIGLFDQDFVLRVQDSIREEGDDAGKSVASH